jgi:hypothetical protein
MANIKQFNKGRAMAQGRRATPVTIANIKLQNSKGIKPRVIKGGTGRQVGKGFKVR